MNNRYYYVNRWYECMECVWYGEGLYLEISEDLKEYRCPNCGNLNVVPMEDNKFGEVDDLGRENYN